MSSSSSSSSGSGSGCCYLQGSWFDLRLPGWLVAGVTRGLGFKQPTKVQYITIPKARNTTSTAAGGKERHLVVQARSGTGKTVAFALLALEKAVGVGADDEERDDDGEAKTKQTQQTREDAETRTGPGPEPSEGEGEGEGKRTPPPPPPGGSAHDGGGGGWCVVVCPTRELAIQTHQVVTRLANYVPKQPPLARGKGGTGGGVGGVKVVCGIGGQRLSTNISGPRGVLVCTPGRLTEGGAGCIIPNHLVRRVRMVVLDEADRLMEGTFDGQLGPFLAVTPERARILAFSATYTEELLKRIEDVTGRTSFVVEEGDKISSTAAGTVGKERVDDRKDPPVDVVSLRRIKQYYVVMPDNKVGRCGVLITRVFSCFPFDQAIVFCNDRALAKQIVRHLRGEEYSALFICGGADMPQQQRNSAVSAMRGKKIRILVATDLVSRGMDFDRVTLVVNVDLPRDGRTLLHRIGRTGRCGREGVAVHVLTQNRGNTKKKLHDLLLSAGAYDTQVRPLTGMKSWRWEEENEGKGEGKNGDEKDDEVVRLPPKKEALPPVAVVANGEEGQEGRDGKDTGTVQSNGLDKSSRMDVDEIPEHVQRWLWWKWRYAWWCQLNEHSHVKRFSQ